MQLVKSLTVSLLVLICISAINGLMWGQVTIANSYMQVAADPQNANLTISTVQGDPANPQDDNLTINDPDNSALVLRIYNVPGVVNGTGAGTVDIDLRGSGTVGGVDYSLFGVSSPTAHFLSSEWRIYIPDQTGMLPPINLPSMRVVRECTIVGNAVEIRVKVINNENRGREVGIGVIWGIALSPAFYAASNHSYAIWFERVITKYMGLPDRWFVFSYPSVQTSFQGIVNPQDASFPLPDKVLFATAANILSPAVGYGFEYTPDPGMGVSAVGIYWNRLIVPAKGEVAVITTIGINSGPGDYRRPLSLWTIQPTPLNINFGDDPFTPEVEQAYVTPNPFTVTAFVYNSHWSNLSNVSVTLGLSDGLSFPPGESATKVINVSAGGEQRVSWQVRVNPGTVGVRELVVTAFSPQWGTRQVKVPVVIPYLPVLDLKAGYNLVGFPFEFVDPEPSAALGIPPEELKLARYDPAIRNYLVYRRDLQFNVLERGIGYWLKLPVDRSFVFTNIKPFTTNQVVVPIKRGWNLLSNPFPWQMYLQGFHIVDNADPIRVDVIEGAMERGKIRSTIFVWKNDPTIPPYGGEYVAKIGSRIPIAPFQGFWLYSEMEGNIIFEPPTIWGAWHRRGFQTKESLQLPIDWSIQIIATSSAGRDNTLWLGVSKNAHSEFDRLDLPKVPMPPGSAQISSVIYIGRSEVPLSMDIRAPQSKIVWTLELLNPAGGEVKLQFEGLAQVPQSTMLLLYDPETNQQWSLRSVSSVSISTQPQQPKRLQVIALQTDQLPLRIQGLKVTPLRGRGAQIQFTVTMPAQVQVQIRSLTGRVIWETSEQVSGGRLCSVFWNGRSKSDEVLPSGVYTVVVRAITENGRQTQAQTILRLR